MSPTTVALANLGCKANQYDGTYLMGLLQEHGYRLVDFRDCADIYVINTCTVTDKADADSRNLIRRAKRRNPDGITVVTGCYAQTRPEAVAKLDGVNLVLGNHQKGGILSHLELAKRERDKTHVVVEDIFRQRHIETFGHSGATSQTRAYVKIQDGCNQFCSFCIIPFARGRNRSIPIERVLAELRQLASGGYAEAILTGIHLGTYGQDLEEKTRLEDLLRAIESERPIHRVRVSSIDPEEVSVDMIEIMAGARTLCPHLHIPLQSGDDATLELMRRRYTRQEFRELCHSLVDRIPRLTIGTDVMVGFPYEDEGRFEETYELLKESPVHYFHVFPYSSKKGTPAARMLGQVAPELKKKRASRLRELSDKKALQWRQSHLGAELEVVLERRDETWQNDSSEPLEAWMGYSENYLPVTVQTSKGSPGKIMPCTIQQEKGGRLAGTHQQSGEEAASRSRGQSRVSLSQSISA